MQPLVLGGRPRTTDLVLDVHDKFDGSLVESVSAAEPALVREAVAAAHGARDAMRALAPAARAGVRERPAARLGEPRAAGAHAHGGEAGPPSRVAPAAARREEQPQAIADDHGGEAGNPKRVAHPAGDTARHNIPKYPPE
ncbi:MAG: hypothetical protein AAGB93_21865, partial [Planctomycetota bacterium]